MDEEINIKKIIAKVDDDKSYSIDVDETTTFYEFKKILAAAAHLLKNCFRIYYEDQEYTYEYDDNTIKELFLNIDPVPLKIYSNKDVNEFEDELISVRFNINVPCETHVEKYKMLYCFTCNKSICMDCFSQDHRNHKVEEKADYLAPAQLLMNRIFSNSSLFKADSRLSKYMDCVTFRSNLKLNIFDNLRKLINDLEIKFASCLEYFSTSEDETEKNTNENLELLKKYCIECFIKLKNDINTKGIIIDDQIFLTLYKKLKEVEQHKNEIFEENKQKYEKLNTLLAPFVKQVEKISEELKITFNNYLNRDVYENFKKEIQENIVEKIDKAQVNDFMFSNIGVPRKSLNRMSLGVVTGYKRSGRNTYISPDKKIIVNQKERNPFQKANYSPQQQGLVSERFLGYNKFSSNQNVKQNFTYSKNEEQKIRGTGLSMIQEKNDINMQEDESGIYGNKKIVTTNTNTITNVNNSGTSGNKGIIQKRVEETLSTNVVNNINNINTSTSGIKNILTTNTSGSNLNKITTSTSGIKNILTNNTISENNLNKITTSTSGIKSILTNNTTSGNNLNMNINSIAESNNDNLNTISTVNNVSGINNFGVSGNTQNIKKETSTIYQTIETGYPTQNTKYTQQEYSVHDIGTIPNINNTQTQKNITKFAQQEYIIHDKDSIPNINDNQTQKNITKYTQQEYIIHDKDSIPNINDNQTQKNITKYTQQEYIIHNKDSIPNINDNQVQKKITKTETTTTTITTNNLLGQNRGINSKTNTNLNTINSMNAIKTMNTTLNKNISSNAINSMNSNMSGNINNNNSQGYVVSQYVTTTTNSNQQNIQHSGTQQAGSSSSTSNMFFGEKLVDVLNKEIGKNELEYQNKMKSQNIINGEHIQNIYGKDGSSLIQTTTSYQTVYGTSGISASMFLFMHPIFKTNKIIGAIEDECTGKVEVNFKQAFEDKDIQLNEFPQGGAYCNFQKSLYFTGGQEIQKGVGKIFLRVSVPKESNSETKLVKLPSMIYSHWNHSMISNEKYVFVIGGYNSNNCEYFNLKTLKWEALPNLNSEERQRPMLVLYEEYLYVFMGFTQFGILDSIERININKLGTSKWEKVSISNPENINLKFYGAGIYNLNEKIYFIGGKVGLGNDDSDYKAEIYSFDFDNMTFSSPDVYFSGQLNFIETQFHYCNDETIGNFIELNDGCLATVAISSLFK